MPTISKSFDEQRAELALGQIRAHAQAAANIATALLTERMLPPIPVRGTERPSLVERAVAAEGTVA